MINLYSLVKELTGSILPYGAEHIDKKHMENLDIQSELVLRLINDIKETAAFTVRPEDSIKRLATKAETVLDEIRELIGDFEPDDPLPEPLKIQDKPVADKHIGEPVTYVPDHAVLNGPSHKDSRRGFIRSYNDTYVFVDYGTGTNQATRPCNLMWG